MKSYEQYCGLALALDHVGDRWTLLLIRELLVSPRRFTDLAAALPGAASNLLAERLKALESDGLVEKRELPPPSARTVYALTPAGEALEEPLLALMRWGGRFMLERRKKQAFRPDWLVLSLAALRVPPGMAPGEAILVEVETPEGAARLRLDGEGVRLATAEDSAPLVHLRTTAEAVLGVAAGALDRKQAAEALHLDGARGPVKRVRDWLTAAPTPGA